MKPEIHHALRFAEATYESRCGRTEFKWHFTGSTASRIDDVREIVHIEVLVPPNTMAWITLPRLEGWKKGSLAWHPFDREKAEMGITEQEQHIPVLQAMEAQSTLTTIKVGSGHYSFRLFYSKEDAESAFPVAPLLPPWGRAEYLKHATVLERCLSRVVTWGR